MRITEVTTRIIDVGQNFKWGGRYKRDIHAAFLTLCTDQGMEGYACAWTGDLPEPTVASAIEQAGKPLLIGADPFERPQILAGA